MNIVVLGARVLFSGYSHELQKSGNFCEIIYFENTIRSLRFLFKGVNRENIGK